MNCSLDADADLYAEVRGDYKQIRTIAADGSLNAADVTRGENGSVIAMKIRRRGITT